MSQPIKPLVGVNLLYIRPDHVSGTIRYAFELLRHLVKDTQHFRWHLYIQQGVVLDEFLTQIPQTRWRVRGGLLGRVLLEHLCLPLVARQDKVDLLFSPGFVSPLWGRFAKVVTIHDLYYKLFPQFTRPWQRRYWQLFIPQSMRQADAVIAISDATKQDIVRFFPQMHAKVRRIYLGADSGAPRTELVDWREDPFCLVVGNLTPNKNIECVIQAFAAMPPQPVKVRLIVVGIDLYGHLQAALATNREQLTSRGIQVECLTKITDEALAGLYHRACCLIQASHYEGFGLPVVEAMRRGCPVIASAVPVLREICADAAIYFAPDAPHELLQCVYYYLHNEQHRQQHRALGYQQAQPFQWQHTATATAGLFLQLLHNQR